MTKHRLLKKELPSIFKKNPFAYRYFSADAIAKLLNISWSASERIVNELYFDRNTLAKSKVKTDPIPTPRGDLYSFELSEDQFLNSDS